MYAAQRARHENSIARTLYAIDVATGMIPSCMTCFQPIPGDWLSDIFCSTRCQYRGLVANTPGEEVWSHTIDGPELDVSRGWSGYQHERERTGRMLMRSVPMQMRSSEPMMISQLSRYAMPPIIGAELRYDMTPLDPHLDAEAIREFAESATRVVTELTQAFSVAFTPVAEALASLGRNFGELNEIVELNVNDAEFNKHVKLSPDDPRRAVLSRVQANRARGSGPQRTPFAKRGR